MKRARHLVLATLHPHFNYCSAVLGTCGVSLQDKLPKRQNRTARVLTVSNYDVNAGQLLEVLGWKNLDRLRNILKGHHGIQMPTWVSSGLFSFEIL